MTATGGRAPYPIIPEEERQCLWMTTGVVSYKLCDRNFDCEQCPFDKAITGGRGDPLESPPSLSGDQAGVVNGSVFYHPEHCWVKVEEPEKVRVGIDDLLSQLVVRVEVVILPQVGSRADQGGCFAHLIRDDYIVPLVSPLSGAVESLNRRLKKEPELIVRDPRGEGWLVTLRPDDLEGQVSRLLFGRRALSWYRREEQELIALAGVVLQQGAASIGPTLQDGGVRVRSLREALAGADARQQVGILDAFLARGRTGRGSPVNP